MNNIIKFRYSDKFFELLPQKFYIIETSIESIEGILILNSNINKNKTLVVNSFSNNIETILLPKYFKKNKKLLQENGLNFDYGVNIEWFKILLNNEKFKYDNIFVNTIGLNYHSIEELKYFLIDIRKNDNKTVFLVKYNSNSYSKFNVYNEENEIVGNVLD